MTVEHLVAVTRARLETRRRRVVPPGPLIRAAVLVPIVDRGEASLVFAQRTEHVGQHKGQISFPGGRVDPGDADDLAAALREAHEEVGLDPGSVEVLGFLDDYPTVTRYLVTPVVGMVEDLAEVKPCAREVAEIFEVPLEFVIAPANFERKFFTRDGINVPFFELNWRNYRIWGATAGMLWNLSHRVTAHEG